ncbi:MAG TPA: carboxypeptidase-like regulatory domain-containing protein [Longimicrobium sp.]|jgi:hypothetical protein
MPRSLHPRARPFAALLGLLLLLAAGCENLIHSQYDFAQVRVRTQDASGAPISNVEVVLYTGAAVMGRARTGAEGEHLFPEVAAGAYGVFIGVPPEYTLRPGEREFVDTLTIARGARREVTFVLVAR